MGAFFSGSGSDTESSSLVDATNKVTRAVLFPNEGSEATYDEKTFGDALVWIDGDGKAVMSKTPCLHYKYPNARHIILMSHGNGCDIGSFAGIAKGVSESCKADVLLWEYDGYGICKGKATVNNINERLWNVWNYVTGALKFSASNVVLLGHSIGTGMTVQLNARIRENKENVAGIVLVSPYTSTWDVGYDMVSSFASVAQEGWNSLDKMKHVTCPLLIFHGKKDTLIGPQHSEKLLAAATSKNKDVVWYEGAGHNNMDWDDIFTRVGSFVEKFHEK